MAQKMKLDDVIIKANRCTNKVIIKHLKESGWTSDKLAAHVGVPASVIKGYFATALPYDLMLQIYKLCNLKVSVIMQEATVLLQEERRKEKQRKTAAKPQPAKTAAAPAPQTPGKDPWAESAGQLTGISDEPDDDIDAKLAEGAEDEEEEQDTGSATSAFGSTGMKDEPVDLSTPQALPFESDVEEYADPAVEAAAKAKIEINDSIDHVAAGIGNGADAVLLQWRQIVTKVAQAKGKDPDEAMKHFPQPNKEGKHEILLTFPRKTQVQRFLNSGVLEGIRKATESLGIEVKYSVASDEDDKNPEF